MGFGVCLGGPQLAFIGLLTGCRGCCGSCVQLCKLTLLPCFLLLRSCGFAELDALFLAHAVAVLAMLGAMGAAGASRAAAGRESELQFTVGTLLGVAGVIAQRADTAMWLQLEAALEAAVAPLRQVRGALPCECWQGRMRDLPRALPLSVHSHVCCC